MQQALDLLDDINQCSLPPTGIPLPAEIDHVMEALRARLAQPEQEIESDRDHVEDDGCPTEKAVLQRFWREHQKQEPVAQVHVAEDYYPHVIWAEGINAACFDQQYLYITPPQREWQGLTDEERTYLAWESNNGQHCVAMTEAKLKEKNA